MRWGWDAVFNTQTEQALQKYLTRKRKKPKINLISKKHSTINDWIKSENPELSNNQQKLTQLDTGWGNIPDLRGDQIFRILSGNVNGLGLDTPS